MTLNLSQRMKKQGKQEKKKEEGDWEEERKLVFLYNWKYCWFKISWLWMKTTLCRYLLAWKLVSRWAWSDPIDVFQVIKLTFIILNI
jgi:hypothetical protein